MNLEDVELKVFRYLKEAANPIVPVDVLFAYLRENEEFSALTEADLRDFLRDHELFNMVEPGGAIAGPEMSDAFSRAGLVSRPCAIMKTRVPTERQMAGLMQEELARMKAALSKALTQAEKEGNAATANKLRQTLDHTEALHQRFSALRPVGEGKEA